MSVFEEKAAKLKRQLQKLISELLKEAEADTITILLHDPKYDTFFLPVSQGLMEKRSFEDAYSHSDRISGKILKEGKKIVEDVRATKELDGPFVRREKIHSVIALPIESDARKFGILYVNYRRKVLDIKERAKSAEEFTKKLADIIEASGIIEYTRLEHRTIDKIHQIYQDAADLVYNVIGRPVALWLHKAGSEELYVKAATGVLIEYVENALYQVNDGNFVSNIFKSGQSNYLYDLFKHHDFKYTHFAERAGWKSIFAIPLKTGTQVIGVLEIFSFEKKFYDFGESEFRKVNQIIRNIDLHIENIKRLEGSQKLSEIAENLSRVWSNDRMLKVAADGARELTNAVASYIFLVEANDADYQFSLGNQSDTQDNSFKNTASHLEIYVDNILKFDKTIKIDAMANEYNCPPELLAENIHSLIGIPINAGKSKVGVLLIVSDLSNGFSGLDLELLNDFSNHVGVAFKRVRLVEAINNVQKATAQIFDLDRTSEAFLNDIEKQGFQHGALQFIDHGRDVIETEEAFGIAHKWIGLARHSLAQRDIQTDISETLNIEIIKGKDPRFDDWIYEHFEHDNLVRIFAPLFLIRDENGHLIPPNIEMYNWESFYLKDGKSDSKASYKLNVDRNTKFKNRIEVFGTVEAGYFLTTKNWISIDEAKAFFELTCQWVKNIWENQLTNVLEVVAKNAMNVIGADSASVHFLYNELNRKFAYEACAGSIGPSFLRKYPPRKDGIGHTALSTKTPQFVDESQERINPSFEEGIKAIVCFPLIINDFQYGLLYLHFWEKHTFLSEELELGELFANRAITVIKNSLAYQEKRQTDRALNSLHSVGQFLLSDPRIRVPDLLERIARSAHNILGADLVTIYLYDQKTDTFPLVPPIMEGKFNYKPLMKYGIDPGDAPSQIIKRRKNLYEPNSKSNEVLYDPNRQRAEGKAKKFFKKETFVGREGVCSTAGILLRVGEEIMGVMFMNYRTPHYFPEEEKQLLETFAAKAALGIYNSRLFALKQRVNELEQLHNVSKAITSASNNLKEVLNQIAISAKEVLNADIAVIFPYDQTDDKFLHDLTTFAGEIKYSDELNFPRRKGGTNAVMKSEQGYIIAPNIEELSQDIKIDPDFYRKEEVKSFIGVALKVSTDSTNGVMQHEECVGVLYIDFRRPQVFERYEIDIAKMLANFAATALLAAREHEKRKIDAIKEFNTFGANFAHHVSNLIGTIPPRFNQINRVVTNIDNPALIKNINGLESGILRFQEILNAARDFKKFRAEIDDITLIRFDEIVDRVVNGQVVQSGVKIMKVYDKNLILSGNRSILEMVITNIIKNAISAMQGTGKIELTASESYKGDSVIIRIADNGTGMSGERMKKIFEPFSTTKPKNLGLGLWLSRNAIHSMGGEISVTSKLDKGSTFEIKLPKN